MSVLPAGAIWLSLPMPAVLIDAADRIRDVNPAAENFLNVSARSIIGTDASLRVAKDATVQNALQRCRINQSEVYVNDVEFALGERPPVQCTIQIAPLQDDPTTLLMLISPRVIADRLGRNRGSTSAAKSAIGMAEMLAHEIKNPLAGISGAAQLLAMNLTDDDLELTDLIVEETRRIVKLLEQVEQFGNIRPPERRAINIHDALDRARRSAQIGFASHMLIVEDYDPSLPAT